MSILSLDNTLPKTRTRTKINPDFDKWVTENLGPNYVGKGYSTVEEVFENLRRHGRGSAGWSDFPMHGMNDSGSFRERTLRSKGFIDNEGRWDQNAVAAKWKKEKSAEAEAELSIARQEAFNKVKGSLPDISNFMKDDPSSSSTVKNAAYWKEYYDLPPEARGMMQPGVKRAYYDIVDKALKNVGL